MKRSDRRILTSHVGSLPRPDALIEINRAKFASEAYDTSVFATRLAAAVEDVCRKQAEIGIDVINDGEFGRRHRVRSITVPGRAMRGDASAAGSQASRVVFPHLRAGEIG